MAWWLLCVLTLAPPAATTDEGADELPVAPVPRPAGQVHPKDRFRGLEAVPVGHLEPAQWAAPPVPSKPQRADGKPFTCLARGVIDVETGQILHGKNLRLPVYPASLTKILTTLLAMEAIEQGQVKLDDVITITPEQAHTPESGLWLTPGEHLTLRELLVGVMVRSANDAAFAVACHVGGTPEAFVERMNQRARELGCINSHFVNPHGLHQGLHGGPGGDDHYVTGYDLLLITLEAWRHPLFHELCLLDGEWISWENMDPALPHPPRRLIPNRNKLLHLYDECCGVKTGSTRQAGACLVSAARRENREVLAVTLGSASGLDRWAESEALLRWGLDEFRRAEVLSAGRPVGELNVRGGAANAAAVVATAPVVAALPAGAADPTVHCRLEPALPAPLPKGLPVGWATVTLPSGERREVALVTDREVPEARGAGLGLTPWSLLLALGLVGYGTIAEAHRRGRGVLPPGGRRVDPPGPSAPER